eukprot:CAMPEP_0181124652 /NCGR_PEP_ID=MMETSP1071-20121207/26602_1 /TAXON_ID=35127 /ORGANISM="Thalassiosira sp., Strain NH16" /LENGTH=962 /DNA_ID=CAMNT_0023209985 /DNA_START=207 /DNA_END=3095 /DNA_ORIENTATION=-
MFDAARSIVTKGVYSYYLECQTCIDYSRRYYDDRELASLILAMRDSDVLERIVLHDNYITLEDGGLADAIASSITISDVDLSLNKIEGEGAKLLARALTKNRTVRIVDLGLNPIGDDGARFLGMALRANDALEDLRLYNNKIGAEGARFIAEGLKENKTLKRIFLGADKGTNNVGDVGAGYIAEALKVNTTLLGISLGDNRIGPEGARLLADALRSNRTLRWLDLRSDRIGDETSFLQEVNLNANDIGPEGVKFLAAALKEDNRSLRQLFLKGNRMGDEGAAFLGDALRYNDVLEELDLTNNKIEGKGAWELADALKTNTTLRTITFCANRIDGFGAKSLADALRRNRTLKHLYLEDNLIDDGGGTRLMHAIRDNNVVEVIGLSGNNHVTRDTLDAIKSMLGDNRENGRGDNTAATSPSSDKTAKSAPGGVKVILEAAAHGDSAPPPPADGKYDGAIPPQGSVSPGNLAAFPPANKNDDAMPPSATSPNKPTQWLTTAAISPPANRNYDDAVHHPATSASPSKLATSPSRLAQWLMNEDRSNIRHLIDGPSAGQSMAAPRATDVNEMANKSQPAGVKSDPEIVPTADARVNRIKQWLTNERASRITSLIDGPSAGSAAPKVSSPPADKNYDSSSTRATVSPSRLTQWLMNEDPSKLRHLLGESDSDEVEAQCALAPEESASLFAGLKGATPQPAADASRKEVKGTKKLPHDSRPKKKSGAAPESTKDAHHQTGMPKLIDARACPLTSSVKSSDDDDVDRSLRSGPPALKGKDVSTYTASLIDKLRLTLAPEEEVAASHTADVAVHGATAPHSATNDAPKRQNNTKRLARNGKAEQRPSHGRKDGLPKMPRLIDEPRATMAPEKFAVTRSPAAGPNITTIPPATTSEASERQNSEQLAKDEVERWLRRRLPKLKREDASAYVGHLVDDGFDSEDTLCALLAEDLSFMKKGHCRVLLKTLQNDG